MKEYELSYVAVNSDKAKADFIVAIDTTGEEYAHIFTEDYLKINLSACHLDSTDYNVAKISEAFHKIKCIDDCWKEQDGCETLEDVLENYTNVKGVVLSEAVELDEDYNFHDYILEQDEITGLGCEYFCSVETMYNSGCGMDDEFNGSREECIEYCRKNDLVLGIDAQIAYVECENGIVTFCDRVDFEIPREVFYAYDKNEWDAEDAQKYAKSKDNDLDEIDGYEFLEYVHKEQLKANRSSKSERDD